MPSASHCPRRWSGDHKQDSDSARLSPSARRFRGTGSGDPRTTPARSTGASPVVAGLSRPHTFPQKLHAMGDVGIALRLISHFAFDAQGALITHFLERFHKAADVDFALSQRHFFAPISLRKW